MKLTGQHYAVFGLLLAGVGAELVGLGSWRDALHPTFVAGLFITVGAVLRGTYIPPPAPKE